MNDRYIVKKASIDYLEDILLWLKEEYEDNDQGFYLNFKSTIAPEFSKGNLLVCVEKNTDKAIAFLTCGLELVSVNEDYQGLGLGKYLVEEFIKKYRDPDVKCLFVECTTRDAKEFWKTLGFQFEDDKTGYLMLD